MPTHLHEELQSALGKAYTLDRELGGGRVSRVFVAQDEALDRTVVVKIVSREKSEGVSTERFTREVKLAARLQQANIVPVLASGDANGIPWYSMPFVEGESLRERLGQPAPLTIGEAISILRDVAKALAYAHTHGVVHRDIKPENVLLSGGTAVVTDFGIAKALSAARTAEHPLPGTAMPGGLTLPGMTIGTPAYMAPEQALADPSLDHRVDLYSWGVMAWELLAGEHPFPGRTTSRAMVAAHVTEQPRSLLARKPAVPPAIGALVMQCLAKSAHARPQAAADLLRALDAFETPKSVRTVESPTSAARNLALGVMALLIVALVTALAWLVMR